MNMMKAKIVNLYVKKMSEAQRKDLCAYGHVTTPIVNTAIQET